MSLDRTIAPDFKVVQSINLPETQSYRLDNGIPLHIINIGEQPVVRLEVIFEAGNWYEQTQGVSQFAIKMLGEGTTTLQSAEISEAFDRLGAFIDLTHSSDRAVLTVYCLSRFLSEVLQLVQASIDDSVLPEKELADLKNISVQNLRVNLEKTAYLASSAIRAELFGAGHPYGQSQDEARITNLSIDEVKSHFEHFIRNGSRTIVLAGQINTGVHEIVNEFLGKQSVAGSVVTGDIQVLTDYAGKQILIEKPDSIQSSIRIGRRLFTRHHPDYFRFLVVNEILGGYFGSRLMKNIREEKGLTYGISSNLITLSNDGYFMIGTDVKKEFTQQTIDEIRKEIYRLQEELVGEDELYTVKNFMAGEFAGSLNTAFEVADRRKIILLDGLPEDFFSQYIEQIHATTAEGIQHIARQYLDPDEMVEVVVGGK